MTIYMVYAQDNAGHGIHRCCDADGCLRTMVNRLMDNGATTMLVEELNQERIPTFARSQQQSCCDSCGYTLTYAWQVPA